MSEFRAVDDHQHIRPSRNDKLGGLANAPEHVRQPPQDRGKSDHRQIVDRKRARQSLRAHLPATDADETRPAAAALAQGPHQSGAELITGFLARDQRNEEPRIGRVR